MAQIIIEVGDKKNSSFIWGPTQDRIRGMFSVHNMPTGSTSRSGITSMPDLPGHTIVIDTAARRGAIIDPLLTDQYSDLYREAKRIFKEAKNVEFYAIQKRECNKMDDLEINTWLYWMKRMVDQGQATIRKGQLPEKIEGEYRTNFYDSSAYAKQTMEASELPGN